MGTLEISDDGPATILSLSGKIMGGPEAGQINDAINELIDKGKKKFIIDLAKTEWMNSSGLGILIGAITTLKNNNGKLVLIHVSDRIMNLLRITKLASVFEIADSLDDAINRL